jgi:multiple antibiotic resistance protein
MEHLGLRGHESAASQPTFSKGLRTRILCDSAMVIEHFLSDTLKSFIALFIILDPFLGLSVFIAITQHTDAKERAKQASVAVGVAFGLLILFLFAGIALLNLLGISLPSFVIAGGVILLLLGIQAVLGSSFERKAADNKAAAVIIGTPLLCGPGAMTTVVILSNQYGYWPPIIASIVAMAITWFMLYYSHRICDFLGERLIQVMSRVLGLILAALAAEYIKKGILAVITGAPI